jgi:hypothetical protein
MTRSVTIAALTAAAILAVSASAAAQTAPDPAKTITLADVEAVLKGKFAARTVEPGIIAYEEIGGARVVEISVSMATPGKTIDGVKSDRVQDGEPVEDVAGAGDAAIYRPQGNLATAEKKNKAGDLQWLEVRVQNVEGADRVAVTKRMAIELLKRGAARL